MDEFQISHLNIENGDILVLKVKKYMPVTAMSAMADKIKNLGKSMGKDFKVLVLSPEFELQVLKSSQLNTQLVIKGSVDPD